VIINPGRQAMPLDKLRALRPEALVVEATAERIPFPAGSGRLIVGRKLPNSIDWNAAAKEFDRVLQPGGSVQISVYGPPGQLRQALGANGFTVRPALAEGAEQLVIATKR
jgi:ubiquinone/menaquinone biosynthesis C-methylase UbiE